MSAEIGFEKMPSNGKKQEENGQPIFEIDLSIVSPRKARQLNAALRRTRMMDCLQEMADETGVIVGESLGNKIMEELKLSRHTFANDIAKLRSAGLVETLVNQAGIFVVFLDRSLIDNTDVIAQGVLLPSNSPLLAAETIAPNGTSNPQQSS